jgi:uncharacterized protein
MLKHRWLNASALLVLLLPMAVPRLEAAEIRDRASMFSAEAVRKAKAELDRTERRTGISVLIETIDAIPGLVRDGSSQNKRRAIDQLAAKRAQEVASEGAYLLISKKDEVFSDLLVRERYDSALPRDRRRAVRDALLGEFKNHRFDEGLLKAAQILDKSLASAPAVTNQRALPAGQVPRRGQADAGKFGVGTLIMIGLGILGVLVLLRVLGGAFGRGGGYPAQMGMGGRPGMGPGPGYGPPGYGYGGPRGGGFFSGMLGGLGGAIAGNWLYDQFSGRHESAGHTGAASYEPGEAPASHDTGGDAFVGGDDDGGVGTSWGDAGGSDAGGEWGGGDGGGDWGGGGDGGGDWGGGDWGGGGDGGGW